MITNTVSMLVLCMDHGTVPSLVSTPIMGMGTSRDMGWWDNEEGFPR
jgi:meiotically up-regulated gene 157 (Mug157) protein